MLLEFKNFTIDVIDYVEEQEEFGSLYITDSKISKDDLSSFLSFYSEHIDNYFSVEFDGKSFDGRFGQLVYEEVEGIYNLRLVFVESSLDGNNGIDKKSFTSMAVVKHHVEYINLIKNSIRHDLILSNLSKALKDKGLFSETELDAIFNPQSNDLDKGKRSLYSKVESLEDYLKETYSTLSEMRQELVS
ncbi:hypothetical protein [Bacillus mycoides]|uniref:hypothetical protein n=1 Tax=Bacillus mycoides TaxID=1405 RepID=UPI001C02A1AE|nr:hypothetical protein [Bacillus mycoides]QWG63399.1 hypothetical protein EXW60_21180 [Bacillus mycoides]QWG89575.1 hypothetical protein EXW40_10475 [Bacillus mycoides]QWJ08327.1 hypothetical protein J5V76_10320 [Bacillus mycoides]